MNVTHGPFFMVVPVSGSAVRAVFFPLTTLGFVPTVNGQPHRGISPPKPALWSRPQLGKDWLCLSLCVPSLTLQPWDVAASPPPLQLLSVFLSSSIVFINPHPSVHPSSDLSVCVAFRLTCLSHPELLQVFSFLPDLLQIIKHLLERQLDYLSWLHKSSNGGWSRHCLLHVVMVLNIWTLVFAGFYLFKLIYVTVWTSDCTRASCSVCLSTFANIQSGVNDRNGRMWNVTLTCCLFYECFQGKLSLFSLPFCAISQQMFDEPLDLTDFSNVQS